MCNEDSEPLCLCGQLGNQQDVCHPQEASGKVRDIHRKEISPVKSQAFQREGREVNAWLRVNPDSVPKKCVPGSGKRVHRKDEARVQALKYLNIRPDTETSRREHKQNIPLHNSYQCLLRSFSQG